MGNAVQKLALINTEMLEEKKRRAGGKVVLNLACGDKLWDEAINIDLVGNAFGVKPDIQCDIRELPFENEFVDEVHAIHVLEHFYFTEVEDVIKEWTRVIKPGGWLCIEVPCLEKIVANFQNVELSTKQEYMQLTWLGLYGDQIPGHPEMIHKWCYSTNLLKKIFDNFGYKNVTVEEPLFHLKKRDMRVSGQK
jgi:predicted SAM-dependent methyltransferase